jgi:hypothetical protein
MAKGGNTWCKKLETKRKQYILKKVLGNEVGVMSYCSKAKVVTSRSKDRQSIDDKPVPKGPSYPAEGKSALPRTEGWQPKPHGWTKWGNRYSHT